MSNILSINEKGIHIDMHALAGFDMTANLAKYAPALQEARPMAHTGIKYINNVTEVTMRDLVNEFVAASSAAEAYNMSVHQSMEYLVAMLQVISETQGPQMIQQLEGMVSQKLNRNCVGQGLTVLDSRNREGIPVALVNLHNKARIDKALLSFGAINSALLYEFSRTKPLIELVAQPNTKAVELTSTFNRLFGTAIIATPQTNPYTTPTAPIGGTGYDGVRRGF